METTTLSQPIGLLSELYNKVTCDLESGKIPLALPDFLNSAKSFKIRWL